MRVVKDIHVDESTSSTRAKIPVVDLTKTAPLLGSMALQSSSKTPFYADGTQWLPFGGFTGLESGLIAIINFQTITGDGTYYKVLFDADLSPLTPPHPSFTIDTANNVITINQDGNYLVFYMVTPTNFHLSDGNQSPAIYLSRLQTSIPSTLSECQRNGSFSFVGGNLVPPTYNAGLVNLGGLWTGFLPQSTNIEADLAIILTNPADSEDLFGEGGKQQYMGIVKLA